MQLQHGQTAVVTGAASGIGLALAHRFAAAGLNVVMADVEAEALTTAADQVRAGGGGEEDLAADEVLAVPVADLVDVAVLVAHHRVRTARGLPGLIDRGAGVALRRRDRRG